VAKGLLSEAFRVCSQARLTASLCWMATATLWPRPQNHVGYAPHSRHTQCLHPDRRRLGNHRFGVCRENLSKTPAAHPAHGPSEIQRSRFRQRFRKNLSSKPAHRATARTVRLRHPAFKEKLTRQEIESVVPGMVSDHQGPCRHIVQSVLKAPRPSQLLFHSVPHFLP
jgi:hypothetical protein